MTQQNNGAVISAAARQSMANATAVYHIGTGNQFCLAQIQRGSICSQADTAAYGAIVVVGYQLGQQSLGPVVEPLLVLVATFGGRCLDSSSMKG